MRHLVAWCARLAHHLTAGRHARTRPGHGLPLTGVPVQRGPADTGGYQRVAGRRHAR